MAGEVTTVTAFVRTGGGERTAVSRVSVLLEVLVTTKPDSARVHVDILETHVRTYAVMDCLV